MAKNRIAKITSIIDKNYQEVWDTCCDHGKIGLALYKQRKADRIYFIDKVPSIINTLQETINLLFPNCSEHLKTQTLDASKIKISRESEKVLISICGVGGKESIDILRGIIKENDLSNIDFLLSPQYHLFEVRKFLISAGFYSIKERLIKDGKWFYEVLYISKNGSNNICEVGSNLYCDKNEDYFKRLINYYHLKSRFDDNYQHIYKTYKRKIFGQS